MIALLLAGCALKSGLQIEAGQSFVLGDNEHGAFRARVENVGPVPVELVSRTEGTQESVGGLAPGETVTVRFADGETAVFVNRADTQARLDVRVTGDQGLSMVYQPVAEGESTAPAR